MDTDRLQNLLALVVEDVIETGEPVGSQYLVDAHHLDVSPATVRNWFAELETEGFIAQPHTSSGRVPTEKGYRLYLDEIMEPKPLPKRMRDSLEEACAVSGDTHRKMKALAKASAEIAQNAVLIGLDEANTFYTGLSQLFAQPEFREWDQVVSLSEVLDRLDDVLQRVRRSTTYNEPTALIGTACPFGNACSSIVLTLPDGALFGLLGPMRMDYRQGFALLSMAKELLMNA
jgi:transcriptional regulator of heat shock response